MSEAKVYEVLAPAAERSLIDDATYRSMYERSLSDPEGFWAEMAESHVHWFSKWDRVCDWTFEGDVSIRWFEGAQVNVAYNCLDRHLDERGDQAATVWEGDAPGEARRITYRELHAEVCRSEGLKKELVGLVRKEIGPIASPNLIQFAPGLPKTRSGKIMRRILCKVAANETENLGDTSMLAEPAVVDDIIDNRLNQ